MNTTERDASTLPADDPSHAADPDLAEARDALGRRLGQIINDLASRKDVLLTMEWDPEPGADIAWFRPDMAWVTINGCRALEADTHPDDVDPLTVSGRLRHPVVVGLCAHEGAHARHTRWPREWEPGTGRAVRRAAVLLEEPRIEAAHVRQHPGNRVFLRASARNIQLPDPTAPSPVADRWQAATAMALVLGRVDAGVLTESETRPVADQVEAALGPADTAALRMLVREAIAAADEDQDTLLDIARRWVDLVGADEDEDVPGTGCAAGGPAAGAGSGTTGADDGGAGPSLLADAVASVTQAVSVDAQVSTGALPDPADQERQEAETARQAAARAAEHTAQAGARRAAQRVFAPAPSAVPDPEDEPVIGHRPPTSQERVMARQLGEALRKAQFRGPVYVARPSAQPPGRLSGREAMLGAAQRALDLPVTARPFRQRVRVRSTQPPVTVGMAIDVSRSMARHTDVLASSAWAFAQAAQETGGQAATVAFGASVTPIVSPGQPPRLVTQFQANAGTHRFTEAAAALDGALGLANGAGARVLVIVSDGVWEPQERTGGARAVARLAERGVHVLWICADGIAQVLPHARRIDITDVTQIPAALGSALVAALGTA